MKLLLDANVSWKLCNKFKDYFEDCLHVDSIQLETPAKDIEIWNYAKNNSLTIVTNDEDFLSFSNIMGFPPKLILLRTGNQHSQYIQELLISRFYDIKIFYDSEDYGVLELYSS